MTGMTRHEEEHGHDHDHGHGQAKHPHGHAGRSGGRRGLLLALTITSLMMVAEIAGGILSNSLALLSDAGHMFTDSLALGLSFFAMKFADMPATDRKTYGFYGLEARLRAHLEGPGHSSALFDTLATTRALEAAYAAMADQYRRGVREPIEVAPD